MKCIFCDGEDVHDCPGGRCDVHKESPFSVSAGVQMDVFPGKLDARAYQPPEYETHLSIERQYNFPILTSMDEGRLPQHMPGAQEAFALKAKR